MTAETSTPPGLEDPVSPGPEIQRFLWRSFVDHVTAAVVRDFEAADIAAIVLKGAGFSRLLYDDFLLRYYSDCDVLISLPERPRAELLLRERGFVRVDRDADWLEPAPKYAHTFHRAEDGARVDLHWSISGVAVCPEHVWSALFPHRVAISVNGTAVPVLDGEASALLIALHNAHHGAGRSQNMEDLNRAAQRLPLEVWNGALSLAGELGAVPAFSAGLRLTASGDAIANRLRLAHAQLTDVWLKSNPSTHGARVIDKFAQSRSLRARLRICFLVLFPQPKLMRVFFPLARTGLPGLLACYIFRPLRLLALTMPATREWLRARHASRATWS